MTGPMPEGTRAIVDQAIEDGAQAIIQPEIPLSAVSELLAALQGSGIRAVMAMRAEQIGARGHSAENDDFLPIGWLPMEARQALERARDQMNAGELGEARRLLVEGAALALAAIDRLDRALKARSAS